MVLDGGPGSFGTCDHIETGVLDADTILFDRRSTLTSCRKPEQKEGLSPVEDTSMALGVIEDVQGGYERRRRSAGVSHNTTVFGIVVT